MALSPDFTKNLGPSASAYTTDPTRATTDAYGRPITRHDWVPATGPWQTDPQLQALLARLRELGGSPDLGLGRAGAAVNPANRPQMQALADVRRYVDANRARLGIPPNYTVADNGQLYDPNQNELRNTAIAAGAIAGGVIAAPAIAGAVSAPAASAAGSSVLPSSVPVSSSALTAASAAPTVATGGATAGGAMATPGFFSRIGSFLSSPGGQMATQVGGNLVGGIMQNRAASQASDAQLQAAREALAFEKGVYDKDVADFAQWQELSPLVIGKLRDSLTQPAAQPVTAQSLRAGATTARPVASGMTIDAMRKRVGAPALIASAETSTGLPASSGMVQMTAPTGETAWVRPEAVAKYEARGARRIA